MTTDRLRTNDLLKWSNPPTGLECAIVGAFDVYREARMSLYYSDRDPVHLAAIEASWDDQRRMMDVAGAVKAFVWSPALADLHLSPGIN